MKEPPLTERMDYIVRTDIKEPPPKRKEDGCKLYQNKRITLFIEG